MLDLLLSLFSVLLFCPSVVGFLFSLGCCCADCLYFSDTFDRADSTNLGSDWTEAAGDWSIASNKLQITTASAVAKCNTAQGNGTANSLIAVTVRTTTLNDLIRVILDYQDTSNYKFVELKVASGGNGYLQIYKRVAGVETLLSNGNPLTLAANTDYELRVCMTGGDTITAYYAPGSQLGFVVAIVPSSSHANVALGTGGTVAGTVTFDSFVATQTDGDCPRCSFAPCDCLLDGADNTARSEYKVVIGGTMATLADPPCTSTECSSLLGTYYVRPNQCAPTEYIPYTPCVLIAPVSPICSSFQTAYLLVAFWTSNGAYGVPVGNWITQVSFNDTACYALAVIQGPNWAKDWGNSVLVPAPDCRFNNQAIPFATNVYHCDGTNATATLTAL